MGISRQHYAIDALSLWDDGGCDSRVPPRNLCEYDRAYCIGVEESTGHCGHYQYSLPA
jgi:hypothetical protein